MVDYEQWVGIVRSVAGAKGADLSDFDTNSQLVSVAAAVWRDRKPEIQSASQSRARGIADGEVNVR